MRCPLQKFLAYFTVGDVTIFLAFVYVRLAPQIQIDERLLIEWRATPAGVGNMFVLGDALAGFYGWSLRFSVVVSGIASAVGLAVAVASVLKARAHLRFAGERRAVS